MKTLFAFVAILYFTTPLCAQSTGSNLPLVLITTANGQPVPDSPRVPAMMKIIYNGEGQRNYLTDATDLSKLNYNGRIEIEIRGSSSQVLPKKQYGFTTIHPDNSNNNVSLLGMPEENDWVLNGLAFDASLIRDYISYNLSAQLGNYAPRQRYCEVIINNFYQGLYILQEKVKVDDNRVNITKIAASDITLPDLSGGYLTKADKVTTEDPSAWTMPTYLGSVTDFIHEKPNPSEITGVQHSYIRSVFENLASSAKNNSITSGYPSIIDIPSFVDFMLINELAANVDAYQFSTFFHKDRNGKLRAGPLWDLNLTFGNDLTFWGLDRSKTNTWQFNNGDNIGPRFWRDLFDNSTFKCYLARRWNELTQPGQPLNEASISGFIDETVALISEAIAREHQQWGTIPDHEGSINGIKAFIAARIPWMTSNLGAFSSCSAVPVPSLVINRIHYHPETSAQFPSDDDQEWIEIVNTGAASVSLTGLYFRGTGFVYQFPAGATLQANGVIQLVNNRSTFWSKYGYEPFGEFTRNLSNKSEKLSLADAFGNVIDEVEYSDSPPWPDADGNGSHLKLSDPGLDNRAGANWIATNESISSTEVIVAAEENIGSNVNIWPNPSEGVVRVSSPGIITSVELADIQGRLLSYIDVNDRMIIFSMQDLHAGVYFLKIISGNRVVVEKVIKR